MRRDETLHWATLFHNHVKNHVSDHLSDTMFQLSAAAQCPH